jgi:hypothetical protein
MFIEKHGSKSQLYDFQKFDVDALLNPLLNPFEGSTM